MKTFLICPVRGHDPNEAIEIVHCLEAEGWVVHYPPRDTDQTDPVGLQICQTNLNAIKKSDVVHILWDGKSTGSIFDMGMAFALGKKIIILDAPPLTEGKSFPNMMRAWEKQ